MQSITGIFFILWLHLVEPEEITWSCEFHSHRVKASLHDNDQKKWWQIKSIYCFWSSLHPMKCCAVCSVYALLLVNCLPLLCNVGLRHLKFSSCMLILILLLILPTFRFCNRMESTWLNTKGKSTFTTSLCHIRTSWNVQVWGMEACKKFTLGEEQVLAKF